MKGGRLDPAHAIAMGLAKQICYDDEMGGPVDDNELKRITGLIGNKTVIMHGMHGMTTLGATVADAFDAFYFTERWAMYTVLARQTGQELHALPERLFKDSPTRDKDLSPPAQQAHLNAWMRVLDIDEGDYKS